MEPKTPKTNSGQNTAEPRPPKIREQVIRGIRYVYEDKPYWDSVKKQTRHKRNYIGRYERDGTYVDTTKVNKSATLTSIEGPCIHKFFGATRLLEQISIKEGIYNNLKLLFPNSYTKLLSLAFFLIVENKNDLYRFEKFQKTHYLPYTDTLISQRISELLATVTETEKLNFFKYQFTRSLDDEFIAYDTTSISSYSQIIKQVKFGHNKEGDDLPQVNLAVIIGEKSLKPLYYRILPGNITDVTTIKKFITDITFLKDKPLNFVMDRGFYSAENVHNLIAENLKFIIRVRNDLKFVRKFIDESSSEIFDISNFYDDYELYSGTKNIFIPLNKKNDDFTISNINRKRIYVHIYFNPQKATDERIEFDKNLNTAIAKFLKNDATDKEKKLVNKYCIFREISDREFRLEYNKKKINIDISTFGYFSLISNYIKDPKEALSTYKNKDFVEKVFINLKSRFNLPKIGFYSFENFEDVIFIQFIALIILFYIDLTMKKNNLYKNYTLSSLLDELDVISIYNYGDNKIHYSEITSKQKLIYEKMGFTLDDIFKNLLNKDIT
jgi:transposase